MAEWEFELEGMTVRPGQMLHVAPDYHQRAGAAGRAERYDGAGAVMLRSDNGAVPWVPVHALSWQPHPETVAMEEMRRVGIERPGRRDVGLWLLARSYGVEGTKNG